MILIFFLKVCPSFGAALIKGILDRFVPDEFCPDAIPEAVLQVLDSEVSRVTVNFQYNYVTQTQTQTIKDMFV